MAYFFEENILYDSTVFNIVEIKFSVTEIAKRIFLKETNTSYMVRMWKTKNKTRIIIGNFTLLRIFLAYSLIILN